MPAANVIGLIMAPELRRVAAGLVLGLAGATASARLLNGVALLATLVPGIRAATIPPVTVLQRE